MTTEDAREPVDDRDWLLRRVPDQPERMWTRKSGTLRPSSAAFKPAEADGGLSIDIRRMLPDPAEPTSALAGRSEHGLTELQARQPRAHGLDVIHSPLPDRYSHGDVVGFDRLDKPAAKRAQRELAKAAAWLKLPASAA